MISPALFFLRVLTIQVLLWFILGLFFPRYVKNAIEVLKGIALNL